VHGVTLLVIESASSLKEQEEEDEEELVVNIVKTAQTTSYSPVKFCRGDVNRPLNVIFSY